MLKILVVLQEIQLHHKNVVAYITTQNQGLALIGEAWQLSKCLTSTNRYWDLDTIVIWVSIVVIWTGMTTIIAYYIGRTCSRDVLHVVPDKLLSALTMIIVI